MLMSCAVARTVRSLLAPGLASLALLWLGGCATEPAKPKSEPAAQPFAPFVPLDAGTRAAITCTQRLERALADGRIEVLANVRNESREAVKLEAQCAFQSASGLPTEESAWQAFPLAEGATETLRFTASKLESKLFSVRVRAAR